MDAIFLGASIFLLFLEILLEDGLDLARRRLGIVITIHHDHGADGAAAQAGHSLQSEPAVRGCFSRLEVQLLLEFRQYLRSSPDVAGRSQTYRDHVPAAGFEAEGPVECGHADDVDERDLQRAGDDPEGELGKLVVLVLDVLQDRDEGSLPGVMLGEDGFDLRVYGLHGFLQNGMGFFAASESRRFGEGDREGKSSGRRPRAGEARLREGG